MNELSRVIKWECDDDGDDSRRENTARKTITEYRTKHNDYIRLSTYAEDLNLLYSSCNFSREPNHHLPNGNGLKFYYSYNKIIGWYEFRYSTVKVLKNRCKELGIKRYSKMRKNELFLRLDFYERLGFPFHYSYDKILGR